MLTMLIYFGAQHQLVDVVVEKLTKVFGDFVAVRDLSFEVRVGEILGIIGENGAGKTTTLKILAGLMKKTSGRIVYFGKDLEEWGVEIKRRIGYLPEHDALYENMYPKEYLKFFSSIYGVGEDRIDKLLELFGLPNDRLIGSFSKGMKRKLSICRTLVHDPDVLIYDEPLSGLDPATSLSVSQMIRGMKDKAVIFSAHNLYYVEATCSKILIMKRGRAVYYGEIGELKDMMKSYRLKYSVNGEHFEEVFESSEDLNRAIKKIVAEGGKIEDVESLVPRLEEIYFKLTGRV